MRIMLLVEMYKCEAIWARNVTLSRLKMPVSSHVKGKQPVEGIVSEEMQPKDYNLIFRFLLALAFL